MIGTSALEVGHGVFLPFAIVMYTFVDLPLAPGLGIFGTATVLVLVPV